MQPSACKTMHIATWTLLITTEYLDDAIGLLEQFHRIYFSTGRSFRLLSMNAQRNDVALRVGRSQSGCCDIVYFQSGRASLTLPPALQISQSQPTTRADCEKEICRTIHAC